MQMPCCLKPMTCPWVGELQPRKETMGRNQRGGGSIWAVSKLLVKNKGVLNATAILC